jgi:uncharacterized protein
MQLFIPGPVGTLEAVLWAPPGGVAPRAAAVVCHPHPLFGGTLNNNVVFRTARGLQDAGLAVLRFNFRGVGRSEGVHDGAGGEVEDLGAALDRIAELHPRVETWAAGFSFGARVAAQRAGRDARIHKLVLVALPVGKFDCSFLREVRQPGLILMAGNDEYGTLPGLRERFPDLSPALELDEVPGVGHFFEGATQDVSERVRAWAVRQLERST